MIITKWIQGNLKVLTLLFLCNRYVCSQFSEFNIFNMLCYNN